MFAHLLSINATQNKNIPLPEGLSWGDPETKDTSFKISTTGLFTIDGRTTKKVVFIAGLTFFIHEYPIDISGNGFSCNSDSTVGYMSSNIAVTLNINVDKTFVISVLQFGAITIPSCQLLYVFIGNSDMSVKEFDGSNINKECCIIGVGPDLGSFTVTARTNSLDQLYFTVVDKNNIPRSVEGNLPLTVSNMHMGILHFRPTSYTSSSSYLVQLSSSGHSGKVNGAVRWDGNRAYMVIPPNVDPQNWFPGVNKWVIYIGIAVAIVIVVVSVYFCCSYCRKSNTVNYNNSQLQTEFVTAEGYYQPNYQQQAQPPTYGLQP